MPDESLSFVESLGELVVEIEATCHWGVEPMIFHHSVVSVLVVALPAVSLLAAAQERKEFRYIVGSKATISITNNCGSITVKPSGNDEVVITAVSRSDAVTFENEQRGNRIELRASSRRQGAGLADYMVAVPADAFVSLRSSDGRLQAEGLRGDVILEAATGAVDVTNIADGHIHVKTFSGPVTLRDIRHSHLDIFSVGGDLNMHNVTESSVEAHSGSGRITYDGDPGTSGDYALTTHNGDLDISIPAGASVEIKSRSLKGEADQPIGSLDTIPAAGQKNHFLTPRGIAASRFILRSFRGKIHLNRP